MNIHVSLLRKDDLYFVGGGGEESNSGLSDWTEVEGLGRDLALASRCDHTIVSRGDTAMWAAYLAGGEYYTGLELKSQYGIMEKHIFEIVFNSRTNLFQSTDLTFPTG